MLEFGGVIGVEVARWWKPFGCSVPEEQKVGSKGVCWASIVN